MPERQRGNDAGTEEQPLVNLNARVPKHLWRRVRLQSLREGRLLRVYVTEALQEHLQRLASRRPR